MTNAAEDETGGLTLLGQGAPVVTDREPAAALLEAFPNRFPGRNYFISLVFPEYTSLCPVTGQPDFGVICVEYVPDKFCVESKSFKLYMFAYRNHKAFMETVTNNILDDLATAIDPRWCRVKGLFAPRGGTQIHVFAEKYKSKDADLVRLVAEWKQEPAAGRQI